VQNPSVRQTKLVDFSKFNNIPDAAKFCGGNTHVVQLTAEDFHEKLVQ
jgi:hypothetical protein